MKTSTKRLRTKIINSWGALRFGLAYLNDFRFCVIGTRHFAKRRKHTIESLEVLIEELKKLIELLKKYK